MKRDKSIQGVVHNAGAIVASGTKLFLGLSVLIRVHLRINGFCPRLAP
jgi:hypothetical protein